LINITVETRENLLIGELLFNQFFQKMAFFSRKVTLTPIGALSDLEGRTDVLP
jgi:hypothetical protein